MAVDYTVHLGHVYTESHAHSRGDKVRDAATVMGVTVVAGGITTFGCATFMFPCQLTFFSKMATLIGGTISFSLLYSLFYSLGAVSTRATAQHSSGQHGRATYR